MSSKRIITAALFKATALGASLVNVVAAGFILSPDAALLYLAMLSTTQLMIPFAGLGMGQRLVRTPPIETKDWRVGVWFLASAVIGAVVLALQASQSIAAGKSVLLALCAVFMAHIIASEWIRAGVARQRGFFLYNIGLLGVAALMVLLDAPTLWLLVPALLSLGALAATERAVFARRGTVKITPRAKDLRTAVRVSATNQFYNVIVVLLSLLSQSPEILAIVLVWRFNILLNWQTFYWLRFGHKNLQDGATAPRRRENRKVNYLNWAACSAAIIAAAVVNFTLIGEWLSDTAFNADFFKMLALYAGIRTAINLIFPHELFTIYGAKVASDVRFFVIAALSFTLIVTVALAMNSTIAILLITEGSALVWRLLAARENTRNSKGIQT